ncbi:uncharacterized protein EDB91DRAFT_1251655 [Suillus paluster]|uniref:uncharacterized protein n=1 Tax=Suillus paluster TaxID=48578 RepID=UPI001B85EC20|nr:uncharacterized protein EDB91DRAFT_1251655 [Suillus paluster]KAG1732928.1 hypothetical protein EDB91DRAFT_1251655 [Suillus paluster]
MTVSKPASKVLAGGTTISSNVPPPPIPISIPDDEGLKVSDEDDELLAKPLSHLTSEKALTTLQQLSEWCNTLSNVALTVLTKFMTLQDDLKTDQDHKDFTLALLKKLSFLFGNITEDGQMSNPFQSDLIIQVLVQHKCATSGAVSLLGMSHTVSGHSKGTLALATATACVLYSLLILLTHVHVFQMERAIRLFANEHILLSNIDAAGNGKQSSVPLAFSDVNWGAHTRSYMTSINHLPDSVILQNSELAQALAVKRRGTWMDVDKESEDERALIC